MKSESNNNLSTIYPTRIALPSVPPSVYQNNWQNQRFKNENHSYNPYLQIPNSAPIMQNNNGYYNTHSVNYNLFIY